MPRSRDLAIIILVYIVLPPTTPPSLYVGQTIVIIGALCLAGPFTERFEELIN